jgi:ribitol 2-dehydrogenase
LPTTSTSLSGKTALVTGASRGIGAATADALNAAGANVVAVSRTGNPSVDLSRAFVIESPVPDILIHLAGAFVLAPIEQTDPQAFDDIMALNVGAAFRLMHTFLPRMRARGSGHIVTVGSIADHVAFPENSAYAASKYAVRGLHEVLREELRGSTIRATLISPAAVDTAIWDTIGERPGLPPRSAMLKATDVADAILYALTRPDGVTIDEIRISHT